MAITSKQLETIEDLSQFWGDPFGHRKLDYSARAATDLEDFVAYCFFMSCWVPSRHARAFGDVDMSESVYMLRDQFMEVLETYHDVAVDTNGKLDGAEPIYIGDHKFTSGWLSLKWSVEAVYGNEIVFGLTTDGLESNTYKARLDCTTLTRKPASGGPTISKQLHRLGRFNSDAYAILKLARTAHWCRRAGLMDAALILRCVIDAIGDAHGDIGLLAKQAELFREVQDSARRSSLTRALSAAK